MAWHYAIDVLPINGQLTPLSELFEHDGNYANAIGQPDGNWYRVDVNPGGNQGYIEFYGFIVCLDFGVRMDGIASMQFYSRGERHSVGHGGFCYASNNPACWGDFYHPSWVEIWSKSPGGWCASPVAFQWNDILGLGIPDIYRYLMLADYAARWHWYTDFVEFQSFRIDPQYVYSIGALGVLGPKSLVCDHEYGDTLYLGLHGTDGKPIVMWVDWDFADYSIGYSATGGSSVGVQTVELRDTCIAYGQFGTDKQIIVSEDKLDTWDEAQGEFGGDDVTTLEYHQTSGDNLIATRRVDQDAIRTLTQRAPWTDVGATPFVARSQLRVSDDVWIGSDTGGSSVVQLLSDGSWADKSVGLPNIPINDLELGY